jgi:hypothetical protein
MSTISIPEETKYERKLRLNKEWYHRTKDSRTNEQKEKVRRQKREWYQRNNTAVLKQQSAAYKSGKNKAKYRRYYQKNKIKLAMHTQVRLFLLQKKEPKSKRTREYLGYGPEDLIPHLEKLFQPGMNWDNYGLHGWHIDHKKPQSWFKVDEIKECFALENLQPMWAKENCSKNNRYEGDYQDDF